MRLALHFDIGARVVELRLGTLASHSLLWLLIFATFWVYNSGRITYHRIRIKYLRTQFKRNYFKGLVETRPGGTRSYKYQPLRGPESQQIRLLELLSNGSIRTQTSSLAGPGIAKYEALSYCWGNTTELYRVDVLVGGEASHENVKHLWVPRGLRLALEQLKMKDSVRVLWIDAICINQTDLSEKNWQVSMMTDIYRNARRVVVYLDIPGCFENHTGDIIPRLVRAKQIVNASSCPKISWDDFDRHRELQELTKPPSNRDVETASLYVFDNPWFSRVWIIQENSLAHDALVIYEGWELPWKSLSDAYEWVGKSTSWKHLAGNTRLALLELSRANSMREDLCTLLLRHRGTLASDPRDHVFALAGLAQDGNQLTVNYELSASEIFLETAKHILINQKNLRFLAAAGMSQRSDPMLPSWAPDLRTKPLQIPLSPNVLQSASDVSTTCSGTYLSLRCCKVGRVTMTGDSAPELPQDISRPAIVVITMYSTLFKWRRSMKAYSANFYAMGCVKQTEFVWPCLSGPTCQARHSDEHSSSIAIQLWFNFLASSLPVPRSFAFFWEAIHVAYWLLLLFLIICHWIKGKHYMRIIFDDVCFGRRLIGTENGHVGLAPSDTEVGDEIFLLKDVHMLIIVRHHDGKSMLVGEGYLAENIPQNAKFDGTWQTIMLC